MNARTEPKPVARVVDTHEQPHCAERRGTILEQYEGFALILWDDGKRRYCFDCDLRAVAP